MCIYIIGFFVATVDVIYLTDDVKMYTNTRDDNNVRLLIFSSNLE